MHALTEKEALRILPAVIDDEASQKEREAFFAYIAENSVVRNQYKDALLIKKIIAEKCKREPAPLHLKKNIHQTLKELDHRDSTAKKGVDQPTSDQPIITPGKINSTTFLIRVLSATAVILFFSLVTILLLNKVNPFSSNSTDLILENISLEHFISSNGEFIEPHFRSVSTVAAEQFLRDHYELSMTIPQITGAEFSGIVMAEFVDNYSTPLLEYQQHELNEIIYLFAFNLDEISELDGLIRNMNAVKNCQTDEDFHITEIEDYHIVSWLWDDIWYTAVSNHNGYDLASIIEPLNYSPQ